MSTDSTLDSPLSVREPMALLPERYLELGILGRGGMGVVRRVLDTHLQVELAFKTLAWQLCRDGVAYHRFRREATLTAQLHHPGVVSVHDHGVLSDGRPWYTMTLIQGTTLERHPLAQSLREGVAILLRVTETMAFAHNAAVVHRDLKPSNIMLGLFGEVYVTDWGLGRHLEEPDQGPSVALDSGATLQGELLGSPPWMSPEQAQGAPATRASDVYGVGAILCWLLCGEPPAPRERALASLRQGLAPDLARLEGLEPAYLAELAIACLTPQAERRPTTTELVASLKSWLTQAQATERALDLVAQADELQVALDQADCSLRELQAQIRTLGADILPYDPLQRKRPLWQLEDRARDLEEVTIRLRTRWANTLSAALSQDSGLSAAHERFARYHASALMRSEERGNWRDSMRHEELLRSHTQNRPHRLLRGEGCLSLSTDPPGARVTAYALRYRDRRLVPTEALDLGLTPISERWLPWGSYLLLIEHPAGPRVRYPVHLRRGERWELQPPGGDAQPIWLPSVLPKGWSYVPAGWAQLGGDPRAVDALSPRRVWVGGFAMQRAPVSVGAWLRALDAMPLDQARVRVEQRCDEMAARLVRWQDGRWRAGTDPSGHPIHTRLPVTRVLWRECMEYARSLHPLARLPSGMEWEKAARGADARSYPFGAHVDPRWANLLQSSAQDPRRRFSVRSPLDLSPYGIQGLCGNVHDWCLNSWLPDGGTPDGAVHLPRSSQGQGRIEVRGGAYSSGPRQSRSAGRLAAKESRLPMLGFRLVLDQSALKSLA